MAICRHKIGFLTLRDCGQEAAAQCSVCNRPICNQHGRQVPEGVICLECYVQKFPVEAEKESLKEFHRRQRYRGSGHRPHYYGHYRYFGDEDYLIFEAGAAAAEADTDGEAEASEEVDPEDFLDS